MPNERINLSCFDSRSPRINYRASLGFTSPLAGKECRTGQTMMPDVEIEKKLERRD